MNRGLGCSPGERDRTDSSRPARYTASPSLGREVAATGSCLAIRPSVCPSLPPSVLPPDCRSVTDKLSSPNKGQEIEDPHYCACDARTRVSQPHVGLTSLSCPCVRLSSLSTPPLAILVLTLPAIPMPHTTLSFPQESLSSLPPTSPDSSNAAFRQGTNFTMEGN